MVFLGEISYEIFLIHLVTMELAMVEILPDYERDAAHALKRRLSGQPCKISSGQNLAGEYLGDRGLPAHGASLGSQQVRRFSSKLSSSRM